jgi:integrase
MANLEYINYLPHCPALAEEAVSWVPDKLVRPCSQLPQLFWAEGSPWSEANLWALEMWQSRDVDIKTIRSLFEHLHKYANWLEAEQVDWRHFPQTKHERVLVRYRGFLIEARTAGDLSPSTTTARMRAVIRFYRYAAARQFISREAPKWQDKQVVVRYFDTVGFERTLQRLTTDISIPNRAQQNTLLEDGLLPISSEHMTALLRFAQEAASEELYLMLLTGCFTGARLGTITTLRSASLEHATQDSKVPGMWLIPVGPGTGVSTKFGVSGNLLIPDVLMKILKDYAASRRHLDRVIKAKKENKSYLFLTRHFNPYKVTAVDREMVVLRRKGQAAGLKFLQKFKFHQTRATYGTWLMSICLATSSVKSAIEFVKRAMHHKRESTTFGYITFIEQTKAKIEVANAFTQAFLGLKSATPSEQAAP